ncbi:MAG: hypothetical protein HC897_02245 [Thermoanaerobaculia bacterium]|nr:hypothetical protein [Thermoanaerobaculia bacterium]
MASSGPLGFLDFLKIAFWRSPRLPGLGKMPVNQMALAGLGLLGFANPGFWLLGAAFELVYLFGLASNPRFQKLVLAERKLAQSSAKPSPQLGNAAERLRPESRERYDRLVAQCQRILGISAKLGSDSLAGMGDLRADNLNQLLSIFLRLLTSQELIQENTASADARKLEKEIAEHEAELARSEASADEALLRSKRATLEIKGKRLENLKRAQTSLAVITAELQRIEQQVELIREESVIGGRPDALSARLDAVSSTMQETSRWMDEHVDVFSKLDEVESAGPLGASARQPQAES